MDGATSLLHGPLRPIPLHCQRPASMDSLLYPLHPSLPIHLSRPWKMPAMSEMEKLVPGAFSPVPALSPSLALFQQLRRYHHGLGAPEGLASDLALPKSSPTLPIASSLPALPSAAAVSNFLSCSSAVTASRAAREERAAGVAAGIPPFVLSDTSSSQTSPYGRKLFPCPQCRYTTDRRNNLKRHMLTMHQLSAKLLECCGVLFRTKAALREHALIFHYHGYTCFYCGRQFCRKALLKRHLSVHNGQKEFICNVCDYATSHKSNLERHRRVHVRQEGDPDPHDEELESHRDDAEPLSDDVKSYVSETNSNVDVSCDELSVCSEDDDEEINVHSD